MTKNDMFGHLVHREIADRRSEDHDKDENVNGGLPQCHAVE